MNGAYCGSVIGTVDGKELHCQRIGGHKGGHQAKVRGITHRWSTTDAFRYRTRKGSGVPTYQGGTMVRVPGLVFCRDHQEIHGDTVDPYETSDPEYRCRRGGHRLLYYRARKGDKK